jgi:beta-glucanase (GH16 family)
MSKPARCQWRCGRIFFLFLSLLAAEGHAASWHLIWSDEFNGPAGTGIDTNKWTAETGGDGWGNKELEFYTASTNNAALDGLGCLAITALQSPPHTFKTKHGNGAYSSARLITLKKFSVKYGRIEARIKIPAGQGIWPAFWMMGEDFASIDWPGCGEVDIMENIGKEPDAIHGSLHGPGFSNDDGDPTAEFRLKNHARFADDFHVFAVEWEAKEIRWYVDDQLYERVTPKDLPGTGKWVFNKPFFLLLNLAVGGDWPDRPDKTTKFPAVMAVDYVRVYQR